MLYKQKENKNNRNIKIDFVEFTTSSGEVVVNDIRNKKQKFTDLLKGLIGKEKFEK